MAHKNGITEYICLQGPAEGHLEGLLPHHRHAGLGVGRKHVFRWTLPALRDPARRRKSLPYGSSGPPRGTQTTPSPKKRLSRGSAVQGGFAALVVPVISPASAFNVRTVKVLKRLKAESSHFYLNREKHRGNGIVRFSPVMLVLSLCSVNHFTVYFPTSPF